jgi:CBS domain-containing protein
MAAGKVKEYMTKKLLTLKENASVKEAINMMAEKSISCIIITDQRNKPIGIITERDVVKKVAYRNMEVEQTQVNCIMSSPVISISKDMDIFEAMMMMQKNKFRRVVVTDSDGSLIGLITQTDLFKAIISSGGNIS